MSYALFHDLQVATGTRKAVNQCTSAIFTYQIDGAVGTKVSFWGSNLNTPDPTNARHWIPILTIEVTETVTFSSSRDAFPGAPDQHCWESLMYIVEQGPADVYVRSGVSG